METIQAPLWIFSPWLLVCYGWIGYNIYLLMRAHKEFDKDNNGYLSFAEIGYYFKVNTLAIIFSIWTIPVGVYFAENIWAALMGLIKFNWEFSPFVYIVMGGLSAIFQWGIQKITGNK